MAINKEKALAAAQKFVERGQPDRALAEFARVVQDEPGDTRTWLRMAEIYARRGQNTQACDIYLRIGELYAEQGAIAKAVTVYKNALKLSPGLAPGHLRLGELLEQVGQTSEAVQQLSLAAAAFQKAGRAADALPVLRRIVALAPERIIARIQLAESASQAGETGEAIRELRRAADALKSQGRSDEWVRVAERLIFHEPDNFPVARELAAVYIARKNPRLALAKLQGAAKVAPRDPQNVQLVAMALEQLDPPKAMSIWKELAQLHDSAGRLRERDIALRAALAIDSTDPEGRELAGKWGVIIRSAPSSSPSSSPASSVSALTPRPANDPTRILSEADVFIKYGLLERAVDHLRRLLDNHPGHAEGQSKLSSVLKQLGHPVPDQDDDPLADVKTPPPRAAAPSPDSIVEAVPEAEELTARVSLDALDGAGMDELVADLEQVDFFVEQSMREEARQLLGELATRFPNHPLLLAKMREMEREVDGIRDDDPTGLDARGSVPQHETPPIMGGSVDSRPADSGPAPALPVAVMAAGGEADLSTHGDLGIAYKEMGLHDAAIAEFKLLVGDPARKVFALTMIGECLEAQGALPDAVVRYKEALNSGPVAEAESAQLYYLLGSAFERLGDHSEALYFFEKVAKRGGQFRDVARRIQALKPQAPEQSP